MADGKTVKLFKDKAGDKPAIPSKVVGEDLLQVCHSYPETVISN